MKLVVATPLYPPEIGGPATYAAILAEGLPGQGIEVEVVKFEDVRHLPKILRHYAYYRRVLRAAMTADVVLALDPVSTGLPAMRAAKKAGKPFVVKVVGDYAWEQGRQRFGITQELDAFVKNQTVPAQVRALRAVQTKVALAAAKVIVPSEYLKGILLAWGIPENKIEVIYNAVPIDDIGTIPQKAAELAQPRIVTVARLVPWKGIEGIIEALALLRTGFDAHAPLVASLVIVGEGPEHARLEALAEAKLGSGYIFTGQLTHTDVLATIKGAEIFVLNSTYEGLSHLLIEATALGVPTIATQVGGNPEVIISSENGILVPSGEPRSLAEALARLLADDALRMRLGTAALASAGRFSERALLAQTAASLNAL